MATGLTYKVSKGEASFEEFLWTCARHMGPLSILRDEPNDEPNDEVSIQKLKKHYDEDVKRCESSLIKAKGELVLFKESSKEDFIKQIIADTKIAMKAKNERDADDLIVKERYESMVQKVQSWHPPKEEHNGLKDFMLSQLEDSIKWDCPTPNETPGESQINEEELIQSRMDHLNASVKYAEKYLQQALKSQAFVHAYVSALYGSVPLPDSMNPDL